MKKKLAFLSLALMISGQLFAQTHLTGTVIDGSQNEPLIGATIVVPGTSSGTVTDLDGKFALDIPKGKNTITISMIGFKAQTINVTGKPSIQIILKDDSKMVDEVVVVGYGTMKKSDLSGSLSSINAKDLMKGGSTDLAHGMQGKVAGVNIQQSDGAPGGGMSIVVRGTNSTYTSSQPLFIVDGVPFDTGDTPANSSSNSNQTSNPLAMINPHDIENIEILKDASATAIYGSRGANGVVIITTKRGQTGKTKVNFSGSWGWATISKKLDMLDAETYATYLNEQYTNDATYLGSAYTTLPYPGKWGYQYYADGHANYSTGVYTPNPSDFEHPGTYADAYGNSTVVGESDWQDVIFHTAFQQDYNLSVSGGDDKGYYNFSGNYTDQDGIIKNSGYKRYSLRTNISRHVYKWLELGSNTSFTHSTTNFANTLSYNTGVVRSALLFPPTYSPDMDTSTADDLNWLASNPGTYVNDTKDELNTVSWFSSSYAEITFAPWLKFRQNIGLSYTGSHRGSYYDRHTQEGKSVNGTANKSSNTYNHTTAESILTFDKTINKVHHLNIMGAFTVENSTYTTESELATNFPDDITEDNDMSRALDKATLASDKGNERLASFLGRANYSLLDRYLFTASIRSDGSSKFTDKNKWATFLSSALAWRASEEKFIKNLNIFSNLKFRVSYGETGNQGIGSYRTLEQLSSANAVFGSSLTSGEAMTSWRGPVDPNIRWETTKQWNAGIDFGWFDNRLALTADYYHKNTFNLLQEVIIAPSNGFTNMLTNSGNVTNEGLEFTLNATPIHNANWTWSLNGNISFNKNYISGLEGDQYANTLWYGADEVFIQRNGCPIGAIYGYVEDGFYDNEAEVRADRQYAKASEATVKSKVGEIKYKDINGDGSITTADRTIIGDTNPDFTWGLTNNVTYKDWTLSFLLQGSQGNDIFNGNLQDIKMSNIGNVPAWIYKSRWTADNYENAAWPKATAGYDRTFLISNRYVEDGSYVRLKNISLAYNWVHPFKILGVENVQFSFTATNLFTITNYSWYDPDVNAFGSDSSRRGVDIYSYPASRTFTFNVNATF